MEEIRFVSSEEEKTTLPVKRNVSYTTVQKRNGETGVVPYDAGRFEVLRAVELVLSGVYGAAAFSMFQSGHIVTATVLALCATVEFICGMARPGGTGLGRFLEDEDADRR